MITNPSNIQKDDSILYKGNVRRVHRILCPWAKEANNNKMARTAMIEGEGCIPINELTLLKKS